VSARSLAKVDTTLGLHDDAKVLDPSSSVSPRAALVHELRYRLEHLPTDKKQNAVVIAVLGVAFLAVTSADIRLLRGSWSLYVSLSARMLFVLSCFAAALGLLRAHWPRQQDRVIAAWAVAIGVAYPPIHLSRFFTTEFLGVLFSIGISIFVYYFGMRGPLLPRALVSLSGSLSAIALLFGPRAPLALSGRITCTCALLGLNLIGLISARSFETQRRKQFKAERDQQRARKELAIKLSELAAEKTRAEAMSQARTSFLAAMSHEFRTPMNAVIGLSDLLLESPLATVDKTRVHTISDSARALLGMLNDILDFAKIDAQKLSLSLAAFDLRQLCASVVEMLRPAAHQRDINLVLECDPALPASYLGDDARLRQVLVNLVSNAIKFTDSGSVRLLVSVQEVDADEPTITVRVIDTGIGMMPETVARLFRPFEQADAGITRRYGGTGLGLSISRQIVMAMGSDIQVKSIPGRGSDFSFTLRLPVVSLTEPALARLGGPPDDWSPLQILVVDDYLVNREVAQAKLERRGHFVELASDGTEAIAAVATQDYDVIFMDLQMPGTSGIEATRQVLASLGERPPPYIIALTASVVEEDRVACRQVGMHDFLSKPLEDAQLDAALAKVAVVAKRVAHSHPLQSSALDQLRQVERQGGSPFVARLGQLFLSETHKRLPRMVDALARGDAKSLAIEAHTTRSGCTTVGAMEMAALCMQLEDAGYAGELSQVGVWLDMLAVQLRQVERTLLVPDGQPGSARDDACIAPVATNPAKEP